MPALTLGLRDELHLGAGRRGMPGHNMPNLSPTQGQSVTISGITKDSAGAVLGACNVDLFDTDTDTLQGRGTSDATTGAYSFSAGAGRTYYVRAWKLGAPDLSGTTVDITVVYA